MRFDCPRLVTVGSSSIQSKTDRERETDRQDKGENKGVDGGGVACQSCELSKRLSPHLVDHSTSWYYSLHVLELNSLAMFAWYPASSAISAHIKAFQRRRTFCIHGFAQTVVLDFINVFILRTYDNSDLLKSTISCRIATNKFVIRFTPLHESHIF